MPKVTVYIPNHNYGRYIEKAVESVLSQTMEDFELIIIDDGSTDNTMEILAKYKRHAKIRIIEQSNKGLNVTNNIALRLANGKYIIRLDADDYFDENILLVLSNIFDTKPEVELVYPDYYHVDENNEVIEIVRRQKIGQEVSLLDIPAHGAGTMFRRESLIEVGGYQEEFSCQDGYDIWLKMIKRYKPYNVNNPLFYYRQHPESLTNKRETILNTRREIKRRFVEKEMNVLRPKVLGIIPVIRHSIYVQSGPFVRLAGKPLLWYTLNELQNTDVLDKIVLASDDDEILDYGSNFSGIERFKRPTEYSRTTTSHADLFKYILTRMREESNYRPDAVCILYITAPFRRAKHIRKAIDTMIVFDVDSVISVDQELARCYQRGRFGLSPMQNSRRIMRIEREAIFKENGAIYLSRTDIVNGGRLLGDSIGHITMLPQESIKISSEFDFWMAERIIRDWNYARK